MKHTFNNLVWFAGRIDRRHIQLFLLILSLCLLAFGAGAPAGGSGPTHGG